MRYYVSQKALREGYDSCPIKSINAGHLDGLIRGLVMDNAQINSAANGGVRACLRRVTLSPDELTVELDADRPQGMADDESGDGRPQNRTSVYRPDVEQHNGCIRLTLSISIRGLDGKRFVPTPAGHDLMLPPNSEPRPHIVTAIGKAYRWRQVLRWEPILTLTALARKLDISDSQIRKYLPLINLSPRLLRLALDGTLPPRVSLQRLVDAGRELDWGKHAAYLNLRHVD